MSLNGTGKHQIWLLRKKSLCRRVKYVRDVSSPETGNSIFRSSTHPTNAVVHVDIAHKVLRLTADILCSQLEDELDRVRGAWPSAACERLMAPEVE